MSMEDVAAGTARRKVVERVALPPPAGPNLRSVILWTAGIVLLVAAIAPLLLSAPPSLSTFLFVQDVTGSLLLGMLLLAIGLLPVVTTLGRWSRLAARPRWTALALAAGVVGVTLAGRWTIYHGYALSYDEVMAEFDARIFRTGALIQALPPAWQPYRQALATHFLLPVPGNAAWVSSYLPVNAMLRALFAAIASPALTGPVLLGAALLTIVALARRLWPDRPDAALVAALLLATAPQALITAMTPYAMTGHLTLNLLWLWLFLRGGPAGHGGAILVALLACGLHQVVFHPLFAAPFLFGLLLRRRWSLATFYAVAYAAIGAFWTLYWQELLTLTGFGTAGGHEGATVGVAFQVARIRVLLTAFDWAGLDLMAKNLIRFVTWQSPLLVPLLVFAWPALRRGDGVARPLAAGLGLTTLAMFILLPDQGHGWGYRYLHGLIGSACLLAAQGWITLTRSLDATGLASARARFGLACVAALPLLALRAAQVEGFVAPYAAASAAIRDLGTDIVLIDDRDLVYGSDLVRNTPTLDRPILVLRREIPSEAALQALCARGSVGVFGAAEAERLGLPIVAPAKDRPPTPNPCATVPADAPG
jgi:hypothetical protein